MCMKGLFERLKIRLHVLVKLDGHVGVQISIYRWIFLYHRLLETFPDMVLLSTSECPLFYFIYLLFFFSLPFILFFFSSLIFSLFINKHSSSLSFFFFHSILRTPQQLLRLGRTLNQLPLLIGPIYKKKKKKDSF